MKKATFLRLFMALLICCLTTTTGQPAIGFAQEGTEEESTEHGNGKVPPLLITELVPESSKVGNEDGYEFIEVYNNTDQVIDFSDYRIVYRYPNYPYGPPDDVTWFPAVRDVDINPGEALVLWLENSANTGETVADFNANYGTSLIENENIVKLAAGGGMHNERMRTIVLVTNSGHEVAVAPYNKGSFDVAENMGIFYRYPQDGSNEMVKASSLEKPATPGTVERELVPAEPVSIDPLAAPTIEDLSSASQAENKVQIAADARDVFLVTTMTLHYAIDGEENFREANVERDREDDIFRYTFPPQELIGAQQLDYYLTASNGLNQTSTEIATIDITAGEYDTPPLLITEMLPFSAFVVGRTSGYDFIEVYNNTDQVLNLGDYKILYRFPSATPDVVWFDGFTDVTIDPGDSIVLWAENHSNTEETVDDFNAIFGTNLVENVDIVKGPTGGGMANGSQRELVLATNTGEEIVRALYNENGRETVQGMGIFYQYPVDGSDQMLKVSSGIRPATPGTVEAELVPEQPVAVDTNSAPIIENQTAADAVLPGDSLQITASAEDEFLVTAMTLYVKFDEEEEYQAVPLQRNQEDRLFRHTIAIPETADKGEVQYYFVAANGFQETTSDTYTVQIEADNSPDAPILLTPENGATDVDTNVELSVQVSDPDPDHSLLEVGFYKGQQYTTADRQTIQVYHNETGMEPPLERVPSGEIEFTEEEYDALTAADGEQVITDSVEQFPYHRFEVSLDEIAVQQEMVSLVWEGSSLDGRKVSMYAWNYSEEAWDVVDEFVAENEASFTLSGEVAVADYVRGNTLNVLVQDELPAPEEFDYTFVWLSDTQVYTEVFPELFESQVNWIRDHRDERNIKYVFHTGDIVNRENQEYQWEFADRYMSVLEEANIPYGVLPGDHDLRSPELDSTTYSQHFGEHRFIDQPHYGESYQDNRGHYDLISSHGNDYIMVYMGWQPDDEAIAWMNEVLAKFPDRIAILNFHQYVNGVGARTPMGERLFEEVVVPNPNVKLVLGGHHHGSEVLISEMDDSGDGTIDRRVYQLLGNYQEATRGGDGYMNIMSVDAGSNTIYVDTYSPDLDAYDLFDSYTISLDLEPRVKRVATDYFAVNVYTDEEIGSASNVASGDAVTVLWEGLDEGQTYYWYAAVRNQDEGVRLSDIWHFSTGEDGREAVDIAEIRHLVDTFISTDDIRGPLRPQLTNTARQAEHHAQQGRIEQAIKFLDNFLQHLNRESMQDHISAEAKATLQQKVEQLRLLWNEQK